MQVCTANKVLWQMPQAPAPQIVTEAAQKQRNKYDPSQSQKTMTEHLQALKQDGP